VLVMSQTINTAVLVRTALNESRKSAFVQCMYTLKKTVVFGIYS